MRATPRQGRCASHNGRRCRDSRSEERGPTDSRVSRPSASNEDPEVIACIFLRDEFSARTATATFANFLVARREARGWKLGVALANGLDRCRWSV
ncbi:hypothetical protein ALC62_08598 [Cyphomyrmex costatus]|uniref:Uncharacterized protein n=1 Tax=Cyphomyrmex costatus TaxID=456900 RepID=A0A151IGT7_9HYME|nr:hypothetical protein ALC62_08598 [Cyphomyrmex costatus]